MSRRTLFSIGVYYLDGSPYGEQVLCAGITIKPSAPPLIAWLSERLKRLPNVGKVMEGRLDPFRDHRAAPYDIVVVAPNALIDNHRLFQQVNQIAQEELDDVGIHDWRPLRTNTQCAMHDQWVMVETDRRHKKSTQLLNAIAEALGLPDTKGDAYQIAYTSPSLDFSYSIGLRAQGKEMREILARFPAVVERQLDNFYSLKGTPAVYFVRLQGKKQPDAIYIVTRHFPRKEQPVFLSQLNEQVPGTQDALFIDGHNIVVPLTLGQFDDNEIEANILQFLRRYTRPKDMKE